MACKPDSVQGLPRWMTIPLALRLLAGSSRQPGSLGAKLPCLSPLLGRRTIPIRRCSRWGLPCQVCYQPRGGLLPHRFTLTREIRRSEPFGRFVFCGAFRRVAPPGRYPAPSLHGVRTFLGHPAIRANGAMGTRGHPAIRASLQIGNHARGVNPAPAPPWRPLSALNAPPEACRSVKNARTRPASFLTFPCNRGNST